METGKSVTLGRVGPEAIEEIDAFVRRSVSEPITVSELKDALFSPDQPAIVRFEPEIGLVAVVPGEVDGFVRLMAVSPDRRGLGNGHTLVECAEADLAASSVITVGADAPYFLFPGVPTTETAACVLFERHHYVREETNFNMVVDIRRLRPEELSAARSDVAAREEVDEWSSAHWPNWRSEFLRAFDKGSLALTRDDAGIASLCAFDVNRAQTLGPVASRPELMGKGAGRPSLMAALGSMRDRGYEEIEVLWVGPMVPYARVGGRVGSTFFVYRKRRLSL